MSSFFIGLRLKFNFQPTKTPCGVGVQSHRGFETVTIANSTYLIILSFIPNLNPILSFDGYWIFSDLIVIENLRKTSNEICTYYWKKLLKKIKQNQRCLEFIKL